VVKGTRLRGKGVEFGAAGFLAGVVCSCMQPCGFYTWDHHLEKLVVLHSAIPFFSITLLMQVLCFAT
jgi:hypothetical protein